MVLRMRGLFCFVSDGFGCAEAGGVVLTLNVEVVEHMVDLFTCMMSVVLDMMMFLLVQSYLGSCFVEIFVPLPHELS